MSDTELKFYTVGEVADMFSVTEQTVRSWITKKELSAVRLPSKAYRIQHAELIAFAKNKYDVEG